MRRSSPGPSVPFESHFGSWTCRMSVRRPPTLEGFIPITYRIGLPLLKKAAQAQFRMATQPVKAKITHTSLKFYTMKPQFQYLGTTTKISVHSSHYKKPCLLRQKSQ